MACGMPFVVIVGPLSLVLVVKLMAIGWTPAKCLLNADTVLPLLLRTGVILSVLTFSADLWGGEADEQGDAVNDDADDNDAEPLKSLGSEVGLLELERIGNFFGITDEMVNAD